MRRSQPQSSSSLATPPGPVRKRRAVIYTRKSSEEGLEQEFNSLHAQREACEAYVVSQRSEGWVLVRDHYDDGGVSGGTLDRPGLQRLIDAIKRGDVSVVVVYKIDRLSRSLADFLKLIALFEQYGVTFVSVTQSFNTTTSVGRLMLNMLFSFAQFEREQVGERIRDKFAASRARGMWMGGRVPWGYRLENRRLVPSEPNASLVRGFFERFAASGSATVVARALAGEGIRTPTGKLVDKGTLYKLLNNRVYVGEAVHKGVAYPGEHDGIVSRELWDRVHAILQTSPRNRACRTRAQTPALLKGLIFSQDGRAMSPTHTRRHGRLYRYYVSQAVLKQGAHPVTSQRLAAGDIEAVVVAQLRAMLRSPEIVVRTWRAGVASVTVARDNPPPSESEVRQALHDFDPLWDELFPAEQARIVQLLVERVEISPARATIRLRSAGLASFVTELRASVPAEQPTREAA